MNWRTSTNLIDSGVFTMRHMEMYKGNGIYGFYTGFVHEDLKEGMKLEKQLYNLRIKYICKMLTSEANSLDTKVKEEVNEYQNLQEDEKNKLQNLSSKEILKRLEEYVKE